MYSSARNRNAKAKQRYANMLSQILPGTYFRFSADILSLILFAVYKMCHSIVILH